MYEMLPRGQDELAKSFARETLGSRLTTRLSRRLVHGEAWNERLRRGWLEPIVRRSQFCYPRRLGGHFAPTPQLRYLLLPERFAPYPPS